MTRAAQRASVARVRVDRGRRQSLRLCLCLRLKPVRPCCLELRCVMCALLLLSRMVRLKPLVRLVPSVARVERWAQHSHYSHYSHSC